MATGYLRGIEAYKMRIVVRTHYMRVIYCFVAILIGPVLDACSDSTKETLLRPLELQAKSTCGTKEYCQVHVGEAFLFDWDKLLVLGPEVNQLGAEKRIGRPLPDYQDFCTTLVFLNAQGTMVRFMQVDCIDDASEGKKPAGRHSAFLTPNSAGYFFVVSRRHDILLVHRRVSPSGAFIEFSPDALPAAPASVGPRAGGAP